MQEHAPIPTVWTGEWGWQNPFVERASEDPLIDTRKKVRPPFGLTEARRSMAITATFSARRDQIVSHARRLFWQGFTQVVSEAGSPASA